MRSVIAYTVKLGEPNTTWPQTGGSGEEVAVAAHGENEGAADLEGEDRGEDGGAKKPEDEGMPFPGPEQMGEADGMTVAEMEDLGLRHGQPVGVEDDDAGVDKGKKEQPLQRGHDVDADLGGDVVETEGPGEQKHDDGGGAEERVDADNEGDGEAPTETAGADAVSEQAQEGTKDAAADGVANTL